MSDSEFDYEILGRLSTEKRNQVNGFIDQVISNLSKAYPGYQFSKIEALHFLYLMEGVSGSRGICNYATTVDAIVNMFKGKEALFKEKFGYDLYINGDTLKPINHERILVDLFTYINRGSLITLDPITGKPQIATNNHKYINSISFKIDALSSSRIKFYKVDAQKDYTYPFSPELSAPPIICFEKIANNVTGTRMAIVNTINSSFFKSPKSDSLYNFNATGIISVPFKYSNGPI